MTSSLMARVKVGNTSNSGECPPLVDQNCTPRPLAESKAESDPKSIIRELLSHNSGLSRFEAPPPFSMCCEAEAIDRQNCLELSTFECSALQMNSGASLTPQNVIRNPDHATADPNEIQIECSPTPKKSSLAAAAFSSPLVYRRNTTPTSSYYSKQSTAKSVYIPPFKRNALTGKETPSTATPSNSVHFRNCSTNTSQETPQRTPSTAKQASRTRPSFHPQLVIKKYRRSAAGGGVNEEASMRSLEQLSATVDYLMNLFARQRPPECENSMSNSMVSDTTGEDIWGKDDTTSETSHQASSSYGIHQHHQSSLCDTVNFVDDRLRAVQKDLVSLVGNLEDFSSETIHDNSNTLGNVQTKELLRQMQAKMVRYNILTLYLLSGLPSSKYQVKFGSRALRTCLSCYLNLSWSLLDEYSNLRSRNKVKVIKTFDMENEFSIALRTQDEMMAYIALFHMSAVLRREESALPPPSTSSAEVSASLMEESGSGWGALFSTFTKYAIAQDGNALVSVNKFPRWKWALELASLVQCGNYQRYFTLLQQGPSYRSADVTASTKLETSSEAASYNARFLILARCCSSHSLNLIRLSALRRCNHAFGKGEKVSVRDLARLLQFHQSNSLDGEIVSASKSALEFCRDAGLPVIVGDDTDPNSCFVVMKSAPIEISVDESIGRMCSPGRSNDSFVFGTEWLEQKDDFVSSLTNRLRKVKMNESIDDWEEHLYDGSSSNPKSYDDLTVRVDDDQVLVPPIIVISKLIE